MFSDVVYNFVVALPCLIIIVVLNLGSELPARGHFLCFSGAPGFVTAVVAACFPSVLGWLENAVFVDFVEFILSVIVIAATCRRVIAALNTVSDMASKHLILVSLREVLDGFGPVRINILYRWEFDVELRSCELSLWGRSITWCVYFGQISQRLCCIVAIVGRVRSFGGA